MIGYLSKGQAKDLTDISLILTAVGLVGGALRIIVKQIMKSFVILIKDIVHVTIKDEIAPINEALLEGKRDRAAIISVLSELTKNGGSTVKDKVDSLYDHMIDDMK